MQTLADVAGNQVALKKLKPCIESFARAHGEHLDGICDALRQTDWGSMLADEISKPKSKDDEEEDDDA